MVIGLTLERHAGLRDATHAELEVLDLVADAPLSQAELAAALDISGPTACVRLARMKAKGLVERAGPAWRVADARA